MYPILFQFGHFEIRSYGVIVAISFFIGLWLSVKEANRKGLDPKLVQDFAAYALLGLTTAFFISLFTEMFGIPLTIYLLAPVLGVEPRTFGMHESHLWAYLASRTGLLKLQTGVYLVMVLSTSMIALGFYLLSLGWKDVYRGRSALVTEGIYARLRHPQYLGLILIVVGFLIMWPTLLTLLLAPFLIGRYIFLARQEDRELQHEFGDEFTSYKQTVPAFIPSLAGSGRNAHIF